MKSRGFTLVEVLVVLVITGLASALMAQGLSTTWDNFARLGTRDMLMNQSALPRHWFSESVSKAVLYHPNRVYVEGEPTRFSFISLSSPDDNLGVPHKIEWQLQQTGGQTRLVFSTETNPDIREIMRLDGRYEFEYLASGKGWSNRFTDNQGKVPSAVRIVAIGGEVWTLAKVLRPEKAEVPPELARFGQYEF
ncbi:prepilin-type N-terminal cleavage/methylation domain-containing protein [Aestuariibacter salexigens]|uniref:prepilin-type N-terminal cleavage/methylation domain-containing protein n=1 Tax=Aestuariibacter salexigens TaxID=226010 RepID=UPI00041BA9CC|nr:prepilin-type N-terminal cleavage/methylation domain-containing protein [Aestuariibacter salexigens]